jgi:hypothetical protein
MQSSDMLRSMAPVRTDVSEECIASVIRVQLPVTANLVTNSPTLVTLLMEAIRSSETPVPTRATQHNTPGYGILHNHRRQNLKSCVKK